jgi:hypothetical protein
LQITKYGEKKITYENEEDRIKQEDELTKETMTDTMRSLKIAVEVAAGKIEKPVETVKDKIISKIPKWLEEGPEPNLANTAKKIFDKNIANAEAEKEQANKDKKDSSEEVSSIIDDVKEEAPKKEETKKEESKKEEPVKNDEKVVEKDVFSEQFDDEDLFK